MKKIRVKLIGDEKSKNRGMGFYHTQLSRSLTETGEVEMVESNEDLIHYTFFKHFKIHLPLFVNKPSLVTIHDLTPIVLKDMYPAGIKGSLFHWLQMSAARNMSAIITDSQASKDDIVNIYKIPGEKVFVTHLAAKDIFFDDISTQKIDEVLHKFSIKSDFVLTVSGGPNKNKNLVRLAEACKRINKTLVIVGKEMNTPVSDTLHPEMSDLVELNKYENIITPGFVDDLELLALYKSCSVYCQASLYEGFGLPLLEAMATGAVVTSSNTSSLVEIFEDKEFQFDPYSIDQISETISRAAMLGKDKKEISIENTKRAMHFTWKKTARSTIEAYNYALKHEVK